MERIFKKFLVEDFVVEETGIEEIVKKIYLKAEEKSGEAKI